MCSTDLSYLELVAEVDSLVESLTRWESTAPDWGEARACRFLVRQLIKRLGPFRIRLESPLVVATLGGTGVGKSALVNALIGAEVVATGKARPVTHRPVLICRPDLSPQSLGIDPAAVELVQHELPALAHLVLIDCPDPDTTEASEAPGTNLARLRQILPHCDVLLVVTTQQKYRSGRVAEELARAAPGARLVFVQTHADCEEDIREDWRRVLDPKYASGHIFLVDCLAALADAQAGLEPRGEFAALKDLLTRQLVGSAAARIRRANLLDLVEQTLSACARRIDEAMPRIRRLEEAIAQHRQRLASRLSTQIQSELLSSQRLWESRLLGTIVQRWGFSPFAVLLRLYHGLGSLVLRGLMLRARTPAQMALWGAAQGVWSWRGWRQRRQADSTAARAVAGCWDEEELRAAALVIEGFAAEAGLDRHAARLETTQVEAAQASADVAERLATEVQSLLDRAAQRHTGWWTRLRYDFLLVAMLAALLYRLAKNFFYDSWVASPPAPLLGLDFYLLSAFWLAVWCGLLVWSFASRLRRGLKKQVARWAEGWVSPRLASALFATLESQCRQIDPCRQELARLQEQVATLKRQIALSGSPLGHQRSG